MHYTCTCINSSPQHTGLYMMHIETAHRGPWVYIWFLELEHFISNNIRWCNTTTISMFINHPSIGFHILGFSSPDRSSVKVWGFSIYENKAMWSMLWKKLKDLNDRNALLLSVLNVFIYDAYLSYNAFYRNGDEIPHLFRLGTL